MTTPRSRISAAFWLAIDVVVKIAAAPKPIKIIGTTSHRYGVEPVIWATPSRPSTETIEPMIGNGL